MIRRTLLKTASRSLLALLPLAFGAMVAAPVPGHAASVAEVATYAGADRMDRLMAGAKSEGRVSLYTSAPIEDMTVIAEAFEKKYGVKVDIWRGGSEALLQRAVTEARVGRCAVDIFETNGPELEALHREKLLQAVKSPEFGDLLPNAIKPHGEWVGTRLNVFAAAYNTNLVSKDEVPAGYPDLTDPRWKGRLGIEAEDIDWFATVVASMGEDKGLALFKDIVGKNGLSVRKGHTLLTNLVASGEVPLALTVYNYKADQLKNEGAPIEWFILPPGVARVNGMGMAKCAPHPHAAVLLYDFMLTDGQKILAERDFVPTNQKVQAFPGGDKLLFVDSAQMLDENKKWADLYKQIITNPSN